MKFATVLAFFALVAGAMSSPVSRASFDISSLEGAMASGSGNITAGAAADASSGVASSAIDGPGSVIGAATVGAALSGAMSSPSL